MLGGAGGRGGAGGTPDLAGGGQPNSVSGTGGAGGRGGAGLRLLNSSIANAGTITGGSGGAGGSGGLGSQQVPAGAAGSAGEGGAGIEGAGLSVGNTGTIQGGLSGDGLRRAPAIRFTGGSNLLSLQPAGVLLGAVEVRDGAAATVRAEAGGLALGPLIVTGPLAVDTGIHLLRVAGSIEGIGPLYKDGIGTLVIGESPADNSGFLGAMIVRAGRLDIAGNGALGTASLTLFDNTTLGFVSNNITLANEITLKGLLDPIIDTGPFTATLTGLLNGGGILSKVGSGTLVIAGLNNMTGPTVVAEGTLRAGTINSLGDSSVYTVSPGATLDLAGFDQRINGIVLGGTVSVAGAIPGTVLTSQGAWVGQNGVLRLSTVLGASGSLTDRLVIDDAAVSGNTRVQVVNAGGLGALTTGTGIEIISGINGGTTTAQGTRDGFALVDGHVDAGAFEYRLYPADPGAGESWYLRSAVIVPTVPATELPGVPTTPTNPNLPTLPTQLAGSAGMSLQIPTYRGEVPLFAGLPQQLRQSSFALLDNLHLRVGDEEPASFESLTDGRPLRAWGRVIGIEVDVRQQGGVQPHGVGRLDGFQAGTDLWTDRDFRVGAYVGRLDGELTVDGFAHGLQHQWVGRNDLQSRFIGGYATWFGKDGWYADAVLQAGEHRFELQPLAAPTSRGRATSLLASLEGGKSFDLGDGWKIEPQLQLVHHHLNVGDVTIGGARVRQDAASGWSLRAGVRLKGETTTDAGALQPYARLNLYRQFGGSDRATFDSPAASTPIWSSTGGSSVEAAGGFTLALNDSTYLYGELGKVWRMGGDVSTRSVLRASLGLRVRW
ncbi:Outer membrane protein IcsA autotransporter (fragment) [Burkholderiales bacterium 8X]